MNYHQNQCFRVGKDKPTLRVATSPATRSAEDSSESTESHTASWCATHANCCAIVTLMVFLVGILMIGFFFRPVLGYPFNFKFTIVYFQLPCSTSF